MDLAHLKLVKYVAETGSVTKSAQRLNMPQSAVSRHIASLEAECGGRLFYRTGRGVVLTELGERLMPVFDRILEAATPIMGEPLAAPEAIAGEVRVGLLPPVSRAVVEPLFFRLRAKYPQIRLRISETHSPQLDRELEEGRLDVALLLRPGPAIRRDDQIIGRWETYLVGPPGDPVTRAPTVSLDDLQGLPLIAAPSPGLTRLAISRMAEKAGVTLNIVAETNAVELSARLVQGGGGYLVVPAPQRPFHLLSWATQEAEAGRLQMSQLVNPTFSRDLVISTPALSRRAAEVTVREIKTIIEELKTTGAASYPSPANGPERHMSVGSAGR